MGTMMTMADSTTQMAAAALGFLVWIHWPELFGDFGDDDDEDGPCC